MFFKEMDRITQKIPSVGTIFSRRGIIFHSSREIQPRTGTYSLKEFKIIISFKKKTTLLRLTKIYLRTWEVRPTQGTIYSPIIATTKCKITIQCKIIAILCKVIIFLQTRAIKTLRITTIYSKTTNNPIQISTTLPKITYSITKIHSPLPHPTSLQTTTNLQTSSQTNPTQQETKATIYFHKTTKIAKTAIYLQTITMYLAKTSIIKKYFLKKNNFLSKKSNNSNMFNNVQNLENLQNVQ